MSKILFIALSFALLALTKGDYPASWYREFDPIFEDAPVTKNEDRIYRLPESVVPLEYNIFLDLYFAERTANPFSYDGRAVIVIKAQEENVRQIVLHANVDRILLLRVLDETGVDIPSGFAIEPMYHFLRVNVNEPLRTNVNYTLDITYTSTMNEGPMKRGIWRGWYTDVNGNERIYATTHFQPYNARQAFPCWDEPFFKAVFKLHITRPAGFIGTFSNTVADNTDVVVGNNRIRTDFAATPPMSSYLVTFLVSESFRVLLEDTSHQPPIRVIGRSNAQGLIRWSLNIAARMTDFFDEYFGIPYSTMHPNLLNDHVASPDWASAGTENWGMVSYREQHLIVDRVFSLVTVEHYTGTLITHELAHKWFGNLVTCYWWSNTWINEGFASYFGYIATHEVFPQYEYTDHFNSRYLQTSLAFDSGINTVPMNHEVNTPLQVTGHFGTISYSKAASFLRMTADIISSETFQAACRYFLSNNRFQPANETDLLIAFTQAINQHNSLADYEGFNFTEYYNVWVNVPGYPLLNVEVDHATGNIKLDQERFYLSPSAPASTQVYPIPITFSTQRHRDFWNTKPLKVMTLASDTTHKDAGEEWVIFNHLQHGHYRVNYDEKSWELIGDALVNERDTIHYLNRAQIVDDVFALMRSEKMTFNLGFKVLRFLEYEENLHVWDPAIAGFTFLRNRLRHIPEKQKEFDEVILKQLEHAFDYYNYNFYGETYTETMGRQAVFYFACLLGHKECVEITTTAFAQLRNGTYLWINRESRRFVYTTAIREGDGSDFDYMLALFRRSNLANDALEMLRALGCAKDPVLLNRYLQMTLTKEVRSHDKLNSFNYALLGHQDNAKTVLEFVKNNIDSIRREYVEDSPARPVHSALNNLASYLDEPGLVDYEQWLRLHPTLPQQSSALSAIATARSNMAWGTANADAILDAIPRSSATKAVTSLALLVAMGLLLRFV